MDSGVGRQASPWRGCPIRRSTDQSLLAAPRGLSQPSTSFVGSWCQGIHHAPFLARRLDRSMHRAGRINFLCSIDHGSVPRPSMPCLLNYSIVVKVLPGPWGPVVASPPGGWTGDDQLSGAQKWPDIRRASRHEGRSFTRLCDCQPLRADGSSSSGVCAARTPRTFFIHPGSTGVQPGRGGAEGTRTPGPRRAKAVLSRLSYCPAPGPRAPPGTRQPRPGWASLGSNQGPQSYQDCALAD